MGKQTNSNANQEFSFFAGGIKVNKPTGNSTLPQVIEWIKSGKYAELVTKVRAATNPKEASFLKGGLDYVTLSGIFTPTRKAENLATHSGLMVIDFDHIEQAEMLKMQLISDPYVAACFISPSGAGLKAVVRIKDGTKHKEHFADLAHYFNNVYRLADAEKVDPSGSDVSRACFLSWDPDAYYAPDSKIHVILNKIPEKPKTPQQVAQDASDVEKYVAAVVERIEASQMDICNDYGTEWLLIAFSLSTLGENGRQYFHRISQQNAKYDEKYADEKFDNAVKTSRFTNAAKFFSICKDYGVDVSRPKKEAPAKAAKSENPAPADKSDVIEGDNKKPAKKDKKKRGRGMDDDYEEETVLYTFKGGMKIKGGKYWDDVAPNFQIHIKYKTEDEQENVTWVLEIRRNSGKSEFIEVPHEDFCSAKKLKSTLASKSLGFKIKDNHLDELQSYLFNKTQYSTALKVVRYGYHSQSNVYFFANKALNLKTNELVTPDEFGIVKASDMHLSIPKTRKDMAKRYTLTNQEITFAKFWELYASAHLFDNAFAPACFYIFSLFRDLGLKYNDFSPILYLKGGAGTGKSSMARVLTAAFGLKQEGVNLKSKNTDVSLIKKMSQSSNGIIWFDEFYNDLPNEGLLQAAYDNNGYHKSGTDLNSIETDSVEIFSALALTSNYIPTNPIFFSRCLFIPITSQQKTDEQRKAFDQLKAIEEAGLGQMTIELLKHRGLLEANDNYAASYSKLYKAIKSRFIGQNIAERLIANMAQVMAAAYALHVFGKINMLPLVANDEKEILDEFVDMAQRFIIKQNSIQAETTAASEFFNMIQTLYDRGTVQEGFHFRFEKGGDVLINFRKMYNLFVREYRITFNRTAPDRDTLQSELTTLSGQTEWDAISKPIRFLTDPESNSNAHTTPANGSCVLNYKQLQDSYGVDWESRNS